jgi:hypothetical protein
MAKPKPKDSVRSDHYVETPVFKNALSKQALELAKETAKVMHALEEEFYGVQGWLEELQTSLNEVAADDDPEELEESVRVVLDWNDSLKGIPHGYSQTLHSMERLYDDITDKVAEEFEKHRRVRKAAKTTLSQVNRALKKIDPDVELVRGNGYYFFQGGKADYFEEQGVYGGAPRISDSTVEEWVQEYKEKLEEAKKYGRISSDLHDEPAYSLGKAIAQLKDVMNHLDNIGVSKDVKSMITSLRRDIERTLREIDK